jgi:hypothetical protein
MNEIEVNLESKKKIITTFENGKEIQIVFSVKNKTEERIEVELKYEINPILKKNSNLDEYEKKIILDPHVTTKIQFNLKSTVQYKQISKSCDMPFFLGELSIKTNNYNECIESPTIKIGRTYDKWEATCCEYFKELNLQVFPMGGSDRPDAVIDISGLKTKPNDITAYVQGNDKKMLMETTINEYDGVKLRMDVENFVPHTTLNVKINSIGQIIVADYFSSDIQNTHTEVQSTNDHIITLIDIENLEYLISKYEQDCDHSKVVNVLKSNQLVDKQLIDSIF